MCISYKITPLEVNIQTKTTVYLRQTLSMTHYSKVSSSYNQCSPSACIIVQTFNPNFLIQSLKHASRLTHMLRFSDKVHVGVLQGRLGVCVSHQYVL